MSIQTDCSTNPYLFLSQIEPWSLSAVYLPFSIFLFTHDLWFTLSLTLLSKFVQSSVFLLLDAAHLFGYRYHSPIDSSISSPIGSIVGIILAWYIIHLFQSARLLPSPWTWSNFKLHASYYSRTTLGLLLLSFSGLFLNYDYHTQMGQCGAPIGVVIYLSVGLLVITFLFYLNRNPHDLQWVWCHPPVPKRFSLRTRYNSTYGLWLLAHLGSSLCFMCTPSSGFVIALSTAFFLLLSATFVWFVVDARHRKGEGLSFSMIYYFKCFKPQWGHFGGITSETLVIPGPASYSAVPSLRLDNPGFLLVERPPTTAPKDTSEGAPRGNSNNGCLSPGAILHAGPGSANL